MKAALALFLASCLAVGHAGSTDSRGIAAAKAAEAAGTMSFVGQIELGGPNITLSGDAKSIYEQILKLNPNYDPTVFPEYRERSRGRRQGFTNGTALAARSDHVLGKRDVIYCDVGDPIAQVQLACPEGLDYLFSLNGYCGAPQGWGGCSRVSCSNKCGIFLCNDNPFPISVWCGNIAGDVYDICGPCLEVWDEDGLVLTCQGQIFRDYPPGWNTLLTRQNC